MQNNNSLASVYPIFAHKVTHNREAQIQHGQCTFQPFCLSVSDKLVTSAEEGGYVFGLVCLSVCPSDYSQTCEQILTKFFGGVGHGSRTK